MSSASAIAQTGLNVAQQRLDASAHNVANLQTPGFHGQQVQQQTVAPQGVQADTRTAPRAGAALADDLVNQMSAAYSFEANLKVIRTEQRMLGRLLDEQA